MVMSSLIGSKRLLQENAKLLRYLGGTNMCKVIIARSIVSTQCSRDDMRKTNALIAFCSSKGATLGSHSIVSTQSSRDNMLKTDAPIAFCSSKGATLGSARSDFNQMNTQNIASRSGLSSGQLVKGFAIHVLRSFKSMVSWGNKSSPLNENVLAVVLTSCLVAEDVLCGRQCHGYLLKSGLAFHPTVKTSLLHLYRVLSDVVGAVEVLVSVPRSDTSPYDLLLVEPGEKRFLDEGFNIIRKMMDEHMVWNKATYIRIFRLCGHLNFRDLGREAHNKLLKHDADFDVFVCNALLKMYLKCGNLGNGVCVLYSCNARARNVVSWTTMMVASAEVGSFEELFLLFADMLRDNIAPNESTFTIMLNASAELFSTRIGNVIHACAEKTGFKGHKNVEDALISMYVRTGDIQAAKKVFLGMTHRDIVTWNMMIRGYCLHGFGNESLALFQEMLKSGEDPNDETFVGVLDACGHVEEGLYYLYEVMKQKGVEPDLVHYRCVMNILIKAGQLDEAFNFMVSTPIELDTDAFSNLLSAPHAHRHNISTRIAKLFPDDSATNALCEACGVANYSEVIELANVKKKVEPGMSWIDVNKQTFVFVSLVNGDPQFVGLHKIIKPLFASVKAHANYVPDTGNDGVEDDCDGYHSEQLAVAYALLKTHEAAPICIIKKSGKICDDCHSLMKLISKAKKRLITVRDATRFHHFQDGSCSCADYW